MKSLREQFLEDNPYLTEFEKMACEFYGDVQDMCRDNPNWVKEVTDLLAQVKKNAQFKSTSPEKPAACGEQTVLEPRKPA